MKPDILSACFTYHATMVTQIQYLNLDGDEHTNKPGFNTRKRKEWLKKIINDVSFNATKKEEMVRRYSRRYVAQHWVKNMDLEDMLKKITYEMLLY